MAKSYAIPGGRAVEVDNVADEELALAAFVEGIVLGKMSTKFWLPFGIVHRLLVMMLSGGMGGALPSFAHRRKSW